MKRQEYRCVECGLESNVMYHDGEDKQSILQRIEEDHRKWAHKCSTPMEKLIVETVKTNRYA